MADSKSLAVRLSVEDYAVVQRALVQLGETGDRALQRISASAARMTPALNRSSDALRQVGFQVQDIAVQLQGGQDPFLILSQQGGQLAQSLLGPKTALAATGVLIAAAVGKSLLFKDATEKVTESEKKLAEALEATNKVLLSREQQKWIDQQKQVAESSKKASDALEEEWKKLAKIERQAAALEKQADEVARRQTQRPDPQNRRVLDRIGMDRMALGVDAAREKVQELARALTQVLTPASQFPDELAAFGPDPKKVRETIEALEAERKGIQALVAVAGQSAEATERVTAANKASEEIRKQKLDAGSRDAQQIRSLIEGNAALERQIKRTQAAREAELKTVQQKIAAEEAEIVAMYKATDAAIAAGGKMNAAMQEEIDLLKGQAEEVRKSTIEFDALTGTYRLATRALDEYNKEQELLKRGMDPAEAKRQAQAWAEIREQIRQTEDQQKALVEQLNKQNELMLEPFKNAIQGIQGAFSQMFEDIFTGTTDLFGSLKKVAIRFAAEIATLLVFRPAVGGLLDMVGLGGLAQQMGLGSGGFGAGLAGSAAVSPSFIGPLLPGQTYGGGISSLLGLGGGGSGFLGGGLQTILAGGGLGFAAPQLLRSLGLGIGKGSTGGSLLGAGGGALLGNFLFPGVGGIVGGLAGGFLGDLVGGLFDGGGGMSQQEYWDNVNYYNNEFQKTQARAAFNPTIGAYHAKSYEGGESAYKQALKQAEQEYQALTAKMTELGYDAANFAGVAEAYGRIVAKIGKEFREGMEREMDLALGQATGDMTAAFDDMLLTQGQRRDQIKEVGADLVKAEQVFAAERLSFLQQLTQAQRDMIRATLSSADLALAELADKGSTIGDGLIAAGQAMDVFGANIQDFLKGLSLSDLSPLSAGAKYAQARDTFEQTIAAARGGDAQAIARVQSDLQVFLAASRGMFASGDQYSQDYAMATGLAAALGADAPALGSALGQSGTRFNAALLKSAGVMGDGKVTTAEATPLLAELAALREQLVGLTGPASDAVKQVEDLSQQIEAMRDATAQLPSYAPGDVSPLSLAVAANSNVPGWQQGADAGGPSTAFKDALVAQLYPGLAYDQAPQAARSAVDELFTGSAYSYLMMGGDAAAGTLMNTGLFSASELYDKYGVAGFTGFGGGSVATGNAPGVTTGVHGWLRDVGTPYLATGGSGENWSYTGSAIGSGNYWGYNGDAGGRGGSVSGGMASTGIGNMSTSDLMADITGQMGALGTGFVSGSLNFGSLGSMAMSIAALGYRTGAPQLGQAMIGIAGLVDSLSDLVAQTDVDQPSTPGAINAMATINAMQSEIATRGIGAVAQAMIDNLADMIGNIGTNLSAQNLKDVYNEPNISVAQLAETRSALSSLSALAKSIDVTNIKSLQDLIAKLGQFSVASRTPPGMAAANAPGGDPGTGAGQNDSGHGVGGSQGSENGQGGYAVGGWVTGGIPGRDSVRAWLMPREYVMPVGPASMYAPELEAMRAGTYRAGGDDSVLAELRALRQEVAMLRGERREADNHAGKQRQDIARAAGGRSARRGQAA